LSFLHYENKTIDFQIAYLDFQDRRCGAGAATHLKRAKSPFFEGFLSPKEGGPADHFFYFLLPFLSTHDYPNFKKHPPQGVLQLYESKNFLRRMGYFLFSCPCLGPLVWPFLNF
jgi:hypothetical protein